MIDIFVSSAWPQPIESEFVQLNLPGTANQLFDAAFPVLAASSNAEKIPSCAHLTIALI